MGGNKLPYRSILSRLQLGPKIATISEEMALEEYRRKRDFHKTSEPPPRRITPRQKSLSYLIQKHEATRLHYDFRLELDGVLLSWAVTKGPSINPADKRLAVRTEDHPLSYGRFEGTIPQGEYGGGTVMLWDTGSWEPIGDPREWLKKGHLTFSLHGNRLKGKWGLVRMRGEEKRENWLLIKEDDSEARRDLNGDFLEDLSFSVTSGRSMDEIAQRETGKPRNTSRQNSLDNLEKLVQQYPDVQLATLADVAPEGERWLHEIKFDGYRLFGFVSAGEACIRTRNGKEWTERFPSIAGALKTLKAKSAVLDMEAVILDKQGRSNFQNLQAALGDGGDSNAIVAYVFDLLYLNGKDFTKLPLIERKDKLQELMTASKEDNVLLFSRHLSGQGAELFEQARLKGLEGIVSKDGTAPYVAGRQRSWLKIKCALRQEFIILGYSDARTGSRAIGALYLGYKKNKALKYAGKAGTGFTMKSARDLAGRFEKMAIEKPTLTRAEATGLAAGEWGSIHWIEPSLLCEVSFTEWTEDGHIRHPSFQGLRDDKEAAEVKQEVTVKLAVEKPGKLLVNGINITHPDRVISETGHITKGGLAQYYSGVAAFIMPQLVKRPLSLLRCPSGIDGECFFQRNPGKGLGPDVKPFDFNHNGKKYEYLYIEDVKGLIEAVQMGSIELHPWGAPIDSIDYPDRMIFDLDPAPDVPFEAVKLAAEDLRKRLQNKGLESVLKCTGGKGLHVTVPLAGKDKWPAVKSYAGALAKEMVDAVPEAYIATMSKAKRTGKIFIDYFRNDYTATAIVDYGVRARPGAPVALPIEWKELKNLKSASQFTMADVLKRVKGKKPSSTSALNRQTLPA